MPREATLVCKDVRHRYGQVQALADVSLSFPPGTTTAIIGPDGVGKSTLLGLLSGVRKLQDGEIMAFGGDLRSQGHRDQISHRLAFMPQGLGRNLYPSLSVAENLDFIGRLFGVPRAALRGRIDRLLDAVGLAAFRDRPAGKLSGGMKQKLSLCCALLHDPELLILDEPTTGIDPLSRRQFWGLIDVIRAEQPDLTLIVATAYMQEAAGFDRVIVLDGGLVLEDGRVAEVLKRTGAPDLEAAFAHLHQPGSNRPPVVIPPRQATDRPPVIRAQGLTRRFGQFTAVDNVSFRIEKGEIFGFLGSNGCGKTTTMKMLTGLLPASSGHAWLLGEPVKGHDLSVRLDVGYMSQSFSLYRELSVRANLELHAQLYRIPIETRADVVGQALRQFGLDAVAEAMPEQLPLGQRQRLQLAVACLHKPRVLILDEPTSGVDPVARDQFWAMLGRVSRNDGVTIFVSTHFMGEALNCDRISLMHAGKVLAVGEPEALIRARNAANLDDAFVDYIQTAEGEISGAVVPKKVTALTAHPEQTTDAGRLLPRPSRIWAFAVRESYELLRDRIRLSFALLGPIILALTFGYGISFDVEDIRFAVLDRDQSADTRHLIDAIAASPYFRLETPALSNREPEQRMRRGDLDMLITLPPHFGRDMLAGRQPEVGLFVDGSLPFRAETAQGYLQGVLMQHYQAQQREVPEDVTADLPIRIEPRFRYNQDFRSVFALMPGTLMIIMAMIPAMIAAIGIVRERELGSISNLYTSPAWIGEFLLGKQIPYVILSFASFVTLLLLVVFHFGLTIKGSTMGLLLAGLVYVFATTAFGILVSSFTRTQVAALIASAILTQVPVLSFSGFLSPAAGLDGGEAVIGRLFPAFYFQNISVGSFAKARGFSDLLPDYFGMIALGVIYLVLARFSLRKQEI